MQGPNDLNLFWKTGHQLDIIILVSLPWGDKGEVCQRGKDFTERAAHVTDHELL